MQLKPIIFLLVDEAVPQVSELLLLGREDRLGPVVRILGYEMVDLPLFFQLADLLILCQVLKRRI